MFLRVQERWYLMLVSMGFNLSWEVGIRSLESVMDAHHTE